MKTLSKLLVPAAATMLVSACASNWDIEGTKAMQGQDTFGDALKSEYVMLATLERDEGDWSDAAFFNSKGRAAAMGQDAGPQMVSERDIPEEAMGDLTAAHDRLTAALAAGKESNPAAAAKAQAMFDCWMQEQEENFQPDDIAFCRDGFEAAMEALKPMPMAKPKPAPAPAPMPQTFVVYFGFDSTMVDDAGMSTIDTIISTFKAMNASSVDISGHTDTMGSADYNMMLAQKRADAIAAALGGQIMGGIIVNSYGEGRLAVATGDEVNEGANRRVEVVVTP